VCLCGCVFVCLSEEVVRAYLNVEIDVGHFG
jgi:hypothetical protein